MGRKSVKCWGKFDFGISTTKVLFNCGLTNPLVLESSTTSRMSCAIRSKKCKKSSADQPSGPGLFSFLKLLIISYSSSFVQGECNKFDSSGVINFGNKIAVAVCAASEGTGGAWKKDLKWEKAVDLISVWEWRRLPESSSISHICLWLLLLRRRFVIK